MAKQLPKTITLAGQTFALRIESHSEDDLRCFGETDPQDLSIVLYTRPHEDYPKRGGLRQTLFHECIHAALFATGVGNLLPGGKEEAVVVALEHALWPVVASGLFRDR